MSTVDFDELLIERIWSDNAEDARAAVAEFVAIHGPLIRQLHSDREHCSTSHVISASDFEQTVCRRMLLRVNMGLRPDRHEQLRGHTMETLTNFLMTLAEKAIIDKTSTLTRFERVDTLFSRSIVYAIEQEQAEQVDIAKVFPCLTERERDMLLMMANGYRDKAIAQSLGIGFWAATKAIQRMKVKIEKEVATWTES